MWVVKFRPDGDYSKDAIKIYAEDVNLMEMPLVYITGIRTKHRSTVLVLPKDEAFDELVECDPLIIPYMHVVHVGKLKDELKIFPLGVCGGAKENANGSGIHTAGRGDEHG